MASKTILRPGPWPTPGAPTGSGHDEMSHSEFVEMFPSDDACLDYLKERFYPAGTSCAKCRRPSRFHRIRGRAAYSCQFCGAHVYPTAGTIFHRSTTSLQLWFWVILLMSSTDCRISPRQIQREIGVTYKTARRMFDKIHPLVASPLPSAGAGAGAGTLPAETPESFPSRRETVSLPTRGVWDGRRRRA